jgi:DNA-binding transcriptional MerR regulator
MSTPLTLGTVAERFGVPTWKVRRLFERGILPPAARIGPYRVVDPADLPAIETALREAGYLANDSAPDATRQGAAK